MRDTQDFMEMSEPKATRGFRNVKCPSNRLPTVSDNSIGNKKTFDYPPLVSTCVICDAFVSSNKISKNKFMVLFYDDFNKSLFELQVLMDLF